MTFHYSAIFLYLSTTLLSSCSILSATKGTDAFIVNPEVESLPNSQRHPFPQIIQAELNVPFDECWRVTLDALKQSGYSIQEATREKGRVRTSDRQFIGPAYPWRESYSIRMTPISDTHTAIKVNRAVKVYRRILIMGPQMWMTKYSNGQRENELIERIAQRLHRGGTDRGEN